ncbi:MAG TPA: hypothetical protein VFD49_13775 [Candidatus Dormibacteraeota bacterium]|nr:hypothetical protein [Candidatus Dormibacteraeota bacterium]
MNIPEKHDGRSGPERLRAVLDTSFWTAAWRADVAANCLDLFEIVVPRAVEDEIRANDPLFPRGEFPYATLFRHLRDKMLDPPDPEPERLPDLGRGEASALALAQALGVPVLVNEHRARKLAANLGIDTITVPAVIVALYGLGVISDRAAWRKLRLIEAITAAAIVHEAATALSALGASIGGRDRPGAVARSTPRGGRAGPGAGQPDARPVPPR